MSKQRSVRLSLAGAVALALFGAASLATAQTAQPAAPPPPPAAPMPPPPPPAGAMPAPPAMGSGQQSFEQGTKSSATYSLPDSNGGTLTVNAGMPAHVQNYGPPPSFKSLAKHGNRITEEDATAYPPLDSDFLFASGGGKTISAAQYKKWVNTQGGSP